jgi:hypothetical protein
MKANAESKHRADIVKADQIAEQLAMKAQIARLIISLTGMLIGLIAFLGLGAGWMPVVAGVVIVIIGFIISEMVFRRLADHETYRRDLEDRVRNP